jgi:enoyl-CoA hydratase
MSTEPVVLTSIDDGVATVTLNRPRVRNALSRELQKALPEALSAADEDEDVSVVILTGADPAFCAGLDLKEVGSQGLAMPREPAAEAPRQVFWPWPTMTKPVIGAINGPAVTGGFELALWCDVLIASDRAYFADTHARVGIMPGWGLTVLLPQAIGLSRAKLMSLTGNFMNAAEALQFGLVAQVVPHDELLATTRSIARDIAANDRHGVASVLAAYREGALATYGDAYLAERRLCEAWQQLVFDPAAVETRRAGIVARGRSQLG